MIIQFPELDELVETLTPVVAEEWEHFERVLAHLRKRGFSLGKPRKDLYVQKLNEVIRKGGSREDQLLEKLLQNALIEARSCERFRLLWKGINEGDLSEFYYELMVAEAGHYKNFLLLAKKYIAPEKIEKRWKQLLKEEAEIMKSLEARGDRMH
jgi:tRNA-(ms[2]io[6]A)-hydroxylase